MLFKKIKQKTLPLFILAGILSGLPTHLFAALDIQQQAREHAGVSAVLDSPEPSAFRQTTSFVLQNFGVVDVGDFDTKEDDAEETKIRLFDLKAKFKKAEADTKKLAEKLAETPRQEQFAIGAKLAEYDPAYNAANPGKDNIVSVDLLRELQFLNADYQSILKAISRTTTKGGDLAIIALVSKCCDNVSVITQRRDFIKFLIENPLILETLREQLTVIKQAEPLLFSNYRPFKQERLKTIVKGGLVKSLVKQQFASRPDAEQIATQAELIWKPVGSFLLSSGLSLMGIIDLARSLNSNGKRLANFGNYAQLGVEFVQSVPLANIPFKIIRHLSEKRAWRSFLDQKIVNRPRTDEENPFQTIADGATAYNQKFAPYRWWEGNFWDKQKHNFESFYGPTTETLAHSDAPTNNLFAIDASKDLVRHILTVEDDKCTAELGLGVNRPDHFATAPTPHVASLRAGSATPEPSPEHTAEAGYGTAGVPSRDEAEQKKISEHDKSPAISVTTTPVKTINDQDLVKKANTLLTHCGYLPQERNKIYNKIAILGLVAIVALALPTLEMSYKDYMANYLDLKNLFDSVQSPYNIYQAAKDMFALLAGQPETRHLYTSFIPSQAPAWKHFLKLVTSRTFKKSFGPFDLEFVRKNHGEVVQAYECLTKSQAEIGELIRFYGEIDAYVSMATLVKEFSGTNNNQGTPVRYSAVEFIEDSKYPRFEAEYYWNPMFKSEKVIPNIINLGKDGLARNVIVTGANAGGKSGNLKAILTGIILAQTFGFAPAQKLKMTVFSNILATLKSNDDAANNKSRFQVEAYEMAKVMQRILDTASHKFTAVFSDELFAGTEVDPAIALSRRICLSIAGMDNVMYMLATHYKDLTKLEVLTHGVFKNFKVEVIKLPDGSLFRPYKLVEGIGGTNIAFDVFLEQLGEIGSKTDYLYNMVQQAKDDQHSFELLNPVKTLGKEAFFTDRKYVYKK